MKDADGMKLMAILQQGSRQGRRMAKSEEVVRSGELRHDLDKFKMFEIVDIFPRKTIHIITETKKSKDVEERFEFTMDITEMEPLTTQSSR
jgi:hypothetical protein